MTPHQVFLYLPARGNGLAMPFVGTPEEVPAIQDTPVCQELVLEHESCCQESCVLEAREGLSQQPQILASRRIHESSSDRSTGAASASTLPGASQLRTAQLPRVVHSPPRVAQSRSIPPPTVGKQGNPMRGSPPRSGAGTSTAADLPRQGARVGGRSAGAHGRRSGLARGGACASPLVGFPPGGSPRPWPRGPCAGGCSRHRGRRGCTRRRARRGTRKAPP